MGATHLDELDLTTLKIGGVSTTPSNSVAADQKQTLTGDGAITIPGSQRKTVYLNKAGVIAATLVAPAAGTDDGKEILVIAMTAQADTLTIASGYNGGVDTVGTFGGAVGDEIRLTAFNGKWYVTQNVNVTLS